jgi:hypothetical protein
LLRALQALAVGAAEYNGFATTRVKLDHHLGIWKTYPRRLLFNPKSFQCLPIRVSTRVNVSALRPLLIHVLGGAKIFKLITWRLTLWDKNFPFWDTTPAH